jgi:hypothetical protein
MPRNLVTARRSHADDGAGDAALDVEPPKMER